MILEREKNIALTLDTHLQRSEDSKLGGSSSARAFSVECRLLISNLAHKSIYDKFRALVNALLRLFR